MRIERMVWLAFAWLFAIQISAQVLDMDKMGEIKPRSIGPAGMSGRVTAIAVDPVNEQKIWIGTASGGVWVSDNGGVAWRPVFDDQPVQSIGAIAINPRNPSEIWVGTGEGNPRNSHNSGAGIFRTIDGGRSWQCMGLENTRLIHRIIIHRDDPSTIWVGALGSAWGPSDDRGLYRTNDKGKSWKKVLHVNDRTGVADMVDDPLHPEKLIVAMWEFGRTPWDFTSGGRGSGLYITYDGGENFKRLEEESGLPDGPLGRMGLAVARSKPNIVYALVEAKKENALFRSEDGGHTWKKVATKNIGNRPFYYADIFVDPRNENRIYNLYSLVTRSEDGGKSFDVLLPYSGVHPDHHAFWISPNNPDYLIDGNDGGLNISRDGGKTWHFINNLPLGQFYHINIDTDFPYHVYGGMQDNGSWIGPGYVLKRGGIRNYDWQELYFGDGFDVVPQPNDSRYGYAMSQGGNLGYYDRKTGATDFIKPVHPDGIKLRFNWNAAIAQDPFYDQGIYYGSQFLHYSRDHGQSWAIISPDLTSNDPEKQKQAESGGLTIDATSAENHTTILCIGPSPIDSNVIWVGTDDGRLQLTKDRGGHWSDLSGLLPGCPKGSWIPQIEVSSTNPGEAYVVVNNYRRNDWSPYLYHTIDHGKSWTRVIKEGDVAGHVISVVQDDEEPSLVFAGTEYGLYFSIDAGKNWQKWTAGYPSVPTHDMKIHPRENDLVIGTFGRAVYILDDIGFLRQLARSGGGLLDSAMILFPVPDAYDVNYASYDGIRFPGDAEFIGDNKRMGAAMLTLWKAPEKKEEGPAEKIKNVKTSDKKKKPDDKKKEGAEKSEDALSKGDKKDGEQEGKRKKDEKIRVAILSEQGDTIRTFSRELKDGFNRIYWGLEENGIRYPSRREIREDADPPGGRNVLPGQYKVFVSLGKHLDSSYIRVHSDPRSDFDSEAAKSARALADEHHTYVKRAAEAFDRLIEMEKQMDLAGKGLSVWPDSTQKAYKEMSKPIRAQLDSFFHVYSLPDDLKDGYRDASHTLNSKLRASSRYLPDHGPIGQNARDIVTQTGKEVDEVIEGINSFISGPWSEFRRWLEAQRWTPFGEVKQIER